MTSEPTEPASAVYEIVLEDTSTPKSWFGTLVASVLSRLTAADGAAQPEGGVISVRRLDTGEELFRHIEDLGDDEGHLLDALQRDLEAMTAAEFKARWID